MLFFFLFVILVFPSVVDLVQLVNLLFYDHAEISGMMQENRSIANMHYLQNQ